MNTYKVSRFYCNSESDIVDLLYILNHCIRQTRDTLPLRGSPLLPRFFRRNSFTTFKYTNKQKAQKCEPGRSGHSCDIGDATRKKAEQRMCRSLDPHRHPKPDLWDTSHVDTLVEAGWF